MLDSGANIIAIHPDEEMEELPHHTPLQASTALGATMEGTAEARLKFKHNMKYVPQEMLQGHVLPSLARHTIVGLGVLCDHGCVVVHTASKAYVLHNNKLILTGARKKGQLWNLDPRDSGQGPTANELLKNKNEKPTAIPSHLDMPTVNSITNVYQAQSS